jgi:hypothetical protein
MSYTRKLVVLVASLGIAVTAMTAAAADLKSPDQIKTCLRILMQVTNDFDRQITGQHYARLTHENMEFMEGAQALRQALANESADLRAQVEPALQKAVDAAQHVADMSSTNDGDKLRAGHGEMLKAVNAVFAYFPEDLRPDPNVAPGRPPHPPSQ